MTRRASSTPRARRLGRPATTSAAARASFRRSGPESSPSCCRKKARVSATSTRSSTRSGRRTSGTSGRSGSGTWHRETLPGFRWRATAPARASTSRAVGDPVDIGQFVTSFLSFVPPKHKKW